MGAWVTQRTLIQDPRNEAMVSYPSRSPRSTEKSGHAAAVPASWRLERWAEGWQQRVVAWAAGNSRPEAEPPLVNPPLACSCAAPAPPQMQPCDAVRAAREGAKR